MEEYICEQWQYYTFTLNQLKYSFLSGKSDISLQYANVATRANLSGRLAFRARVHAVSQRSCVM